MTSLTRDDSLHEFLGGVLAARSSSIGATRDTSSLIFLQQVGEFHRVVAAEEGNEYSQPSPWAAKPYDMFREP